MDTGNVQFRVTFSFGDESGTATSLAISLPSGYHPILLHLPAALAATTAALIVLVRSGATYVPVDGYDEDSAAVDPLHIACAATNARSKRLDPTAFAGIEEFKLQAVAADLSTAVKQAVGTTDLVFYGEARRY